MTAQFTDTDTSKADWNEGTLNYVEGTDSNNLELIFSEETESFESGWGYWVPDGNWRRNSGSTPSSGTGPSSAYDGTYYVYVETSSGNDYYDGDRSSLTYTFDEESSGEIVFYLHKYGSNQGLFEVRQYNPSTGWSQLWSWFGQIGDFWDRISVNFSNATQIQLRNTAAGGYEGDVAVDYITITIGRSEGSRISPQTAFPSSILNRGSEISWNATTPGSSTVEVEFDISLDGGTTWEGWQSVSNGGSLPQISQDSFLENAYFRTKQTLTKSGDDSPTIQDLTVTLDYDYKIEFFAKNEIRSIALIDNLILTNSIFSYTNTDSLVLKNKIFSLVSTDNLVFKNDFVIGFHLIPKNYIYSNININRLVLKNDFVIGIYFICKNHVQSLIPTDSLTFKNRISQRFLFLKRIKQEIENKTLLNFDITLQNRVMGESSGVVFPNPNLTEDEPGYLYHAFEIDETHEVG